MAAKAFVLIETVVGRNKDVIALVEGETLNDIGDLITAKIHPIAGISRTVHCLVI